MPALSAFTFAWPALLILIPVLGLAVLHRLPARPAGPAPWLPIADSWAASARGHRHRRWYQLTLLQWALLALIALAAARPQTPGAPITLPDQGRPIQLLLDLSVSMSIPDMRLDGAPADRLTVARSVLDRFIADRAGDQIGVVVFGDQPYLHVPVSSDLELVRALIGDLEVGMAGSRTALGDAIVRGIQALDLDREGEQAVMILLSDGAQTAGRIFAEEAAQFALESNVRIHTIGFGSDSGGEFGNRSDLNVEALQRIAGTTGGQFFRARSATDLATIYNTIDELEPRPGADQARTAPGEWFQWPAGAALLLLLVHHYRHRLRRRGSTEATQ